MPITLVLVAQIITVHLLHYSKNSSDEKWCFFEQFLLNSFKAHPVVEDPGANLGILEDVKYISKPISKCYCCVNLAHSFTHSLSHSLTH